MNFLTRLLRHLSIGRLVLFSVAMTLLPVLMGWVSAFLAVDDLSVLTRQAVHHVANEAKSIQ